MIKAADFRAMPKGHQFAKGEIQLDELGEEPQRFVCVWRGSDWYIKVASLNHSYPAVAGLGKIVDVEKIIQKIQPCDQGAMKLYFK